MAWGPEAQHLVFEMYRQGEPERAIVKAVRDRHETDDKTVRRCIAGLDVLKGRERGTGEIEEKEERFKNLGGTERYLSDLQRAYEASREKTLQDDQVRQQAALDAHQKDLLEEVKRTIEAARSTRNSLKPAGSLELKVHQALREHTPQLARLLDDRANALSDYFTVLSQVAEQMKAEMEKVAVKLQPSIEADLWDWDRTLTRVIEQQSWLEEWMKPGERIYDLDRLRDNPGFGNPRWGEFRLVKSPVAEDKFDALKGAHTGLRQLADQLVPTMRQKAEGLREANRKVVDELEEFTLIHPVPGRCRYCSEKATA